jgi:hypothetical protein
MAAFDISAFREAFPAFADDVIYPDAMIQLYADASLCYLSERSCGCDELNRQLLVAHLLTLNDRALTGNSSGGIVTGASIDKVSVSVAPPPVTSSWGYWLSTTPYGLQLLALLRRCGAGGMYVGGTPERRAFRRSFGRHGR